jgi:hypothetical protein
LTVRLKKMLALLVVAGALVMAIMAVPSAPAFTGHHCSRSTCRFFTSSYPTAIYYYDRRTCDQWKDLSRKYLQGFKRRHALLKHYDRKLHPPC